MIEGRKEGQLLEWGEIPYDSDVWELVSCLFCIDAVYSACLFEVQGVPVFLLS